MMNKGIGKRLQIVLVAAAMVVGFGGSVHAELRDDVKKATEKLQDLVATIYLVKSNPDVLSKMGKSFSQQYEFKKATLTYKSPDKLRMEGAIGMMKVQYIINGNQKIVRVPAIRMTKREDLTEDPHKKQTAIDLGILTDTLWQEYKVKTLGKEKLNQQDVLMLDARRSKGNMQYRLCIDCKTLSILSFEKRDENGALKAKWVYLNPEMVDNIVWVPTRIELYSGTGELAGITEMKGIKVNTGVDDALFN